MAPTCSTRSSSLPHAFCEFVTVLLFVPPSYSTEKGQILPIPNLILPVRNWYAMSPSSGQLDILCSQSHGRFLQDTSSVKYCILDNFSNAAAVLWQFYEKCLYFPDVSMIIASPTNMALVQPMRTTQLTCHARITFTSNRATYTMIPDFQKEILQSPQKACRPFVSHWLTIEKSKGGREADEKEIFDFSICESGDNESSLYQNIYRCRVIGGRRFL